MLILMPIMWIKYGKRPSEYYFLVMYPIIHLVIIDSILSIKYSIKYGFITIFLCLFAFLNWNSVISSLKPNLYGLKAKENTVLELKKRVGNEAFNISFDGPPNTDTGFRYLLRYHGMISVDKPGIRHFEIRIPNEGLVPVGIYGIKLPEVKNN